MRVSRLWVAAVSAVVVTAAIAGSVEAQPRQGGQGGQGGRGRGGFGQLGGFGFGGGFGRGGGGGLIGLLQDPKVQTEIELLDDQKEQLTKVAEAARANRGGPGAGGQGGGERPNFQDMSDEERQEFMAEMRERAEKAEKEARAKLAEILLPHQMERLEQLSLQQRGVAALMDPAIQTKLNITEEQKGKLQKAQEETSAKMRELFQGAGGGGGGAGGNREEIMKKMTELRKASEGGVLAVLTAEQTKAFEEMKGKAFEFSPPQGRFGPGGNRPRPNNDQ